MRNLQGPRGRSSRTPPCSADSTLRQASARTRHQGKPNLPPAAAVRTPVNMTIRVRHFSERSLAYSIAARGLFLQMMILTEHS